MYKLDHIEIKVISCTGLYQVNAFSIFFFQYPMTYYKYIKIINIVVLSENSLPKFQNF